MSMDQASREPVSRPPPVIRAATVHDVVAALEAGLRDLRAAPVFGLFFGAVYALGGWGIVLSTTWLGWDWLVLPLGAGFALIGPFVAVGLYEVSRRLEKGEPLSWRAVLGCMLGQGQREFAWLALICVFALIIWVYQVRLLYALFFGLTGPGFGGFWANLFTSAEGVTFLVIGTAWGAVLAVALFALTVISFPLLLDQDRDFITAMIASVKAVVASPKVMVGWGLMTALILLVATAPGFLGLVVALPVLGHATWHLYRRLVAPEAVNPAP
jgi:uncharacterized membrane protein